MLILARALILTATTLAVWLMIVRGHGRNGQADACRVSYVYDGDTVALACGGRDVTARLQGLDAPETRDARCEAELAAGKAATERLRQIVAGGDVSYRRGGADKYGRWLIRLSVNGRDVATRLIGEGLAVAYAGGARIDWCKRLEAL